MRASLMALLCRARGGRLGARAEKPQTDRQEEAPEKEGDTPAPAVHRLAAERRGQDGREARAQQSAAGDRHLLQARVETALPLDRPFGHESRRAAPFTARREALQHPADEEEDGGEDAD